MSTDSLLLPFPPCERRSLPCIPRVSPFRRSVTSSLLAKPVVWTQKAACQPAAQGVLIWFPFNISKIITYSFGSRKRPHFFQCWESWNSFKWNRARVMPLTLPLSWQHLLAIIFDYSPFPLTDVIYWSITRLHPVNWGAHIRSLWERHGFAVQHKDKSPRQREWT